MHIYYCSANTAKHSSIFSFYYSLLPTVILKIAKYRKEIMASSSVCTREKTKEQGFISYCFCSRHFAHTCILRMHQINVIHKACECVCMRIHTPQPGMFSHKSRDKWASKSFKVKFFPASTSCRTALAIFSDILHSYIHLL